jgi:hypothetical protein
LAQVERKAGDSQLWTGLMGLKDEFLARGRLQVNDGNQTMFWEDLWLGDKPLMLS